MGMTLADLSSTLSEGQILTKAAILDVIRWSKIQQYLPFMDVDDLLLKVRKVQDLPDAGSFRPYNGSYSEGSAGHFQWVYESLKPFGEDFTLDRLTPRSEDQEQIQLKLKSYALTFNNHFINGDSATDPDGWDGIKKRIASLPSRQTVYFGASNAVGLDGTANAANARTFFNRISRSMRRTNGNMCDLILCNEAMLEGIERAAQYLQSSGNFLDSTKDVLGRKITTWREVPIVDMGYLKDQTTEIIPNTELGGTGVADTTSMYFLSFDPLEGVYGVQTEPFKFYDPLNGAERQDKPARMYRVDWPHSIVSFGNFSMVRGRNIKNPDLWTE